MTGHDEFMRTIRDRPGEDAPRLVYADWLEENGYGLYAEFIRLHIKAASESESGAQSRLLASRLLEVWEQRENWGFLPPGWKKLRLESYRRGLLWSWNGPVSLFLRHAHVLWDYGPVVELCVEGTDGMLCKLAQCEYLSRLHSLTIRPSKILRDGGFALAKAKGLKHLKTLRLLTRGRGFYLPAVEALQRRFGERLIH